MSFLRRANKEELKRVHTPDGSDYVDLRAEFSKGEVNKVIMSAPKDATDIEGGLSFMERFAEVAVVGWSLVDENDKAIPFSLDNYRALVAEASQWLDRVLGEHLQATIGKEVDELEGKPSN